jgi:hypothetical protein
MTLDILKVAGELRAAVETVIEKERSGRPALLELLRVFDDAEITRRVASARTSWLLGLPLGRYFERIAAPARVRAGYSCVATDASVVVSDRHGPVQYVVINVGFCVLEYGEEPAAQLGSDPIVLWREEELSIPDGTRRIPITGNVLAMRRMVAELEAALRLIQHVHEPVLALQDGTLIPWVLEGQTSSLVQWGIEGYARALGEFRRRRTPVAGVISYPGSRDIINVLRVAACDYPRLGQRVNCDDCLRRVARGERVQACAIVPDVTDCCSSRHSMTFAWRRGSGLHAFGANRPFWISCLRTTASCSFIFILERKSLVSNCRIGSLWIGISSILSMRSCGISAVGHEGTRWHSKRRTSRPSCIEKSGCSSPA